MAKITGILKLEGSIDNLIFYKSTSGYLVRKRGGIAPERIANDSAFARTRENNVEFGAVASAGKLLRDALRGVTVKAVTGRAIPQITQLMSQIKNLDMQSARGLRTVGVGIVTPEGKAMLKALNLNIHSTLESVLYKPFTADAVTGKIEMKGMVAATDVKYPAGATHVRFKGGFATIDFVQGSSELHLTNEVTIAVDQASVDITLMPQTVPAMTGGVRLVVFGIDFLQELNGLQYSMNNGSYNALTIVAVA